MYNLIVLGTFTVTRSCHHSQYEYEYLTDCGDGLKEGARTQSLAATPCMPMGPSVSHSVLASFPLSDAGKLRLSCSMYVPSFSFSDVVQSLSRVQLFAAPWTAARQASPSINNSQSLLKLMSIKSVMPSSHLILCHLHLLLLLSSIPPSIRVFSNESALRIGWPKY